MSEDAKRERINQYVDWIEQLVLQHESGLITDEELIAAMHLATHEVENDLELPMHPNQK